MNRRFVRSASLRIVLACSAVVLVLLSTNLSAFFIIFGQMIHQDITYEGLNPLGPVPILQVTSPKFELTLDSGTKVTFSNTSIDEITLHNVSTDELQGGVHKRLHFDSEDLAGGSDRLKRLRQNLVLNLVNEVFFEFTNPESVTERQVRVANSRAILGRALHTLQDFYAHTNWVERHNFSLTEINTRLGNAIEPSPAEGSSCNSSQPELAPLTSGFFENDPPGYCGAPANKCAHGGALCGIHKDFLSRSGFNSAQALAIKATNIYTRETLQAVLAAYTRLVPTLGEAGAKQAVKLAVCEFMGVPDAFSTCLTSHTLTVQKLNTAGGGQILAGLVQSTSNNVTPAINCGLACQGTAVTGATVTLTASDAGDWRFVRWALSGACPGSTNPQCNVVVDGNKLAKAEFTDEPLPEPTVFQGQIVLTGPAGITGTGCTGTMTRTGTATVNLANSPSLTIDGSESINLSCYSSTGPAHVTVPLVVVGNSITGQFVGPFTCPAPCVSGQSTYVVNLQRSGTGSNQVLQGTIDYTNENQTPFLATTTGAVTLNAQ
ncbi:MAG TPA: hypothetical protein VFG52_12080 [Xanthomonadales bacterium]|nr:hypothetical protein [Xanthomonadales bacterium]